MIYDKEGKIVCENGICIPEFKDIDPTVGKVVIDGVDTAPKWEDKMVEGEYEVFIDSEYKPGIMKWGVHTIKGVSDREILLFAHLDHPWMANDNLSGVACLIDMAKELKEKGFKHTIKLVFCAETIGSIAYAETEDISKVDFVIAVDSVGNDNSLLIQKSFDKYSRLNYCMHLACSSHAVDYRKGDFRFVVGSDEYYFNDPKIGIPGIMLSRIPYPEYHTADDIPEIIKEEKIKQTQNTILEIIDIYERDYIPVRHFTGPLMRSKYGIQTGHKSLNMGLDYLFYDIDGEKYLSELVLPLGLSFNFAYEALEKVDVISKKDENKLSNPRKKSVKKTGK
jgi:aminopeptidase-like protein